MELKPGEVLCPDCKGSSNQARWDIMPDYGVYLECQTCNNKGKMDWIEAVVGVRPKLKLNTRYGHYFGMKKPQLLCSVTCS